MPSLDVRLRLVRKLPRPAQIAALEAALTVAGTTEGSEIALQLLEIAATEKPLLTEGGATGLFRRRRRPAQAVRPILALLRAWPILGEDERAAAVAIAGGNIAAVLDLMADDRNFAHRIAAARIAARHPSAETIPVLSRLIIDTDDDVQVAAEKAFEAISIASSALDTHTLEALDQALAEAGRGFADHRKPGVLTAIAAQLHRPGPRLSNWLLDEHQTGLLALRGLIRRDKTPETAIAAIRLLGHPTLHGAARSRLENLTNPDARRSMLAQWPFLLNPVAARAVSALRRSDQLFPGDEEAEGLGAESNIGVCVWATSMRIAPAERARLLTRIALRDDERAALAAVRRLGALPRPDAEARSGLFQATTVGSSAIACLAASALVDDHSPAARNWMQGLGRSPHRALREIADLSIRRFNPWATVQEDDPLGNVLETKRALRNDTESTLERIREFIRKGDPERRLRAMRLATRLGIDAHVELELLKALTEDDPKVVASATLALRRIRTTAARAALLACVDHEDPRVVANAIEALAWRQPDHPRVLLAAEHDVARTRANSLRARLATLNDRNAQLRLRDMLGDDRPEHRLSALWVAQRTGQTGLSRDIARLLRDETDERVIARGHRCARLLLAQLRLDEGAVIDREAKSDSGIRRFEMLEELK
ncbi:MAG: HEAT repeat domain-containing protein [Phycisphaeraceae bacterium]|nr:HEAT repeat domain-containing protein [Phycisphaeraceae bacterium]MCB9847414.1 HEAT repeat domain-containing protein [Phycisphaeraceae bacterium]